MGRRFERVRFTRFWNKVNDRMPPGLGESACSPVGVEVGSEMVNGEVIQVAKESVGDAVWARCNASAEVCESSFDLLECEGGVKRRVVFTSIERCGKGWGRRGFL